MIETISSCLKISSLINIIIIIILVTCLQGALSSSLIDGTVRLRSISSTTKNEATIKPSDLVKVIPLDENHGQLIVDQVNTTIIFIVKNASVSSNVYLSYDNGDTYHKIHGLQVNGTNAAVISSFYMHPEQSRVIYLADVINRNLFVTSNSGQHFEGVKLSFKPSLLVPHQDKSGWIIGYDDQDDGYKQIWLSSDGGIHWQAIQEDVKQFAWGSSKLDANNTIFMITGSRNGGTTLSSIVAKRRSSLTENGFDVSPSKTWLTNVDKFILQGKHLFAVRRARNLGSSNHQVARDLWISVGRENFRRVILPPIIGTVVDYHLVDLTEDLIMIGVLCDSSSALLIVSDANGTEFKLSLDNVLSRSSPLERHEKNAAAAVSGAFIDIHKVAGIGGVYVANTLIKKSVNNETSSVITYDNGATWTSISVPVDEVGNKLPCNSNKDCSLHLTSKLNQPLGSLNNPQILTKSSAVGIMMSPGIVATSNNGSSPDLFISNDVGLSFRKILSGSYLYEIIDNGGIIVAVKKALDSGENQRGEPSNEILYSMDLGVSWSTVKFLADDDKVSVYHLLPLDDGKSARFIILCAKSNGKSNNQTNWIVVKIDLTSLFNRSCSDADYSTWIPHDPFSQCLLGRKAIYRRKASKSFCSNSIDLSKPIQSVSCNCTSSDYQCDFGYIQNYTNHGCSPIDPGSEAPPEETCEPGVTFRKSKGYRKTFGNKCSSGVKRLEPEAVLCPSDKNEAPQDPHFKKHEIGLSDGFGTLIAFLIMTILCFIAVGLFLLHQGSSRIPENFRSNYHVSPSDSGRYAINVTFDNKALRSDFEYSDDEPLVQA